MATQPVSKHDAPARHEAERDAPLVMPLAEPGPGAPLVGATSVIGDHIEDGERDPHTIAEEQRIRSAVYEAGMVPPDDPETRRVIPPPPRHTDNHSKR